MTTTANLGITLVEQSQAQKEVTINEALADLDKVIAGGVAVAVTGGMRFLTADEYLALFLDLTGTLASNLQLAFPAIPKIWIVRNSTSGAHTVELIVSASGAPTPVALGAGSTVIVFSDGEFLYSVAELGAPVPLDLGCSIIGKPTSSEVVMRFVAARALTFPASLTGSQGKAGTAATAQTDFVVKKNATSVGTVRFAASGTTASFIAASPIVLAAGDVLSITAPASADATLADISITLVGSR